MSDTFTTNYGWTMPEVGASWDTWGSKWNVNLQAIDTKIHTLDTAVTAAMPKAGGTFTGGISGTTATFSGAITGSGGFVGNLTGGCTGNAGTASKWQTARTVTLTGDASGSQSFDGSANFSLAVTVSTATNAAAGKIRIATDAEAAAGVLQTVAVNPKQLAAAGLTGMVAAFAMNAPPTGWLECDGSAVSRTTYATLFAAIGTTFGAGDGSSTFNVPELRGEFVRGWDDGRGVDSGRAFGSTQSSQNLAHTHTLGSGVPQSGTGYGYSGTSGVTGTPLTVTGSSGGTEARPRNVALLYCIKT